MQQAHRLVERWKGYDRERIVAQDQPLPRHVHRRPRRLRRDHGPFSALERRAADWIEFVVTLRAHHGTPWTPKGPPSWIRPAHRDAWAYQIWLYTHRP